MGCVKQINYYDFPVQSAVGKRVQVCYHYDTGKIHYGVIVRDDSEEPFRTIIALDNGRYLLGNECQYSVLD